MNNTDLSSYDNSHYNPGGFALKRLLWHFCNHLIFAHGLLPVSSFKVFLLRLFGSKIGKGVNIKPSINIKYPWNLTIGDQVWIGEDVWIDNLVNIEIGSHSCLSQGAMLLTGNHDFTKTTFDLITKEITLEEGVWIGAKATVCPGVTCQSHSILTVGSVATRDLEAYSIYQGNPAEKIKYRSL